MNRNLIARGLSAALGLILASTISAQSISPSDNELNGIVMGNENPRTKAQTVNKTELAIYIVELKAPSAIGRQQAFSGLPAPQHKESSNGQYRPSDSENLAYVNLIKQKQQQISDTLGSVDVLYQYVHTFNGFAARLSAKQVDALLANKDVLAVYPDELQQVNTANTPEFLGLNSPSGQHYNGIKGEDIIIGVVDSGIWPENPSFADDGSYPALSTERWQGACNEGSIEDPENPKYNPSIPKDDSFTCNNKLIGARYFGRAFSATYDIRFANGEFHSARDADGHGTHTASTAGGNEVPEITLSGAKVGPISGIAPRARIAAYKVCWNADYVSPEGVNERGCFGSDSMAAIDQAVEDGVDIINYSIGGSTTTLNTPQTIAMLRAAQAGVFVSVSAGNSGPTPSTVGTPAPWVASVAASTYDGDIYQTVDELSFTIDNDNSSTINTVAIEGAFASPLTTDFAGQLMLGGTPQDHSACAPYSPEFSESLSGKIALIVRGACNFVDKVSNAQAAGASGVVVYNDRAGNPIVMGGSADAENPITISAVMINQASGLDLAKALVELPVTVAYQGNKIALTNQSNGNIMASFSSRGPNGNTADIIKPDITAPGVSVLAGTSPEPFVFDGNNPVFGENYAYISGTSMAAPHVAGMAALLKEQHPNWTPAQVKSALMTTAYQSVVKEDEITAATPFDFGAGHAKPVDAAMPGFTYNTNVFDYAAFLCGQSLEGVVQSLTNFSCGAYADAGYSFDASELNYPSIAIGELTNSEVVGRTISDVTGDELVYDVAVTQPLGVDVEVLDSTGSPISTLSVPALGSTNYFLRFTQNEQVQFDEFVFGDVTFSTAQYTNRSPIAVKAQKQLNITQAERLSLPLKRNMSSFYVQPNYSGKISFNAVGVTPPFGSSRSVGLDDNQTFAFNEAGLGVHAFLVGADTKVLRFQLRENFIAATGTDLDLYVYRCISLSCSFIDASFNFGSDESVEIVNPDPANDGAAGDYYLIFVHGFDLGIEADESPRQTTDYTLLGWIVDEQEAGTRVRASSRARDGRPHRVILSTSTPFTSLPYMGAVTTFDNEGKEQGTTIVELFPQ